MSPRPTTRTAPRRPLLLAAAASLGLAACASTPAPATGSGVTFVVVRHAEKIAGDDDDPALADAGRARARALAEDLRGAPLAAAYATRYRRARDTAAPAAGLHGIDIATYDAKADAQVLARQLREAHGRGTVLVVGHSNTVPDIVSALCGCPVDPIDERVYGGRYDVAIDAAGEATLVHGHF